MQLGNLEKRALYNYNTRQQASGSLRQLPELEAKLDVSSRSWCWRATNDYYNLPISIKREQKLTSFKTKLRNWVRKAIDN